MKSHMALYSFLLANLLAFPLLGQRAGAAPDRPNLRIVHTDEHNCRTLGALASVQASLTHDGGTGGQMTGNKAKVSTGGEKSLIEVRQESGKMWDFQRIGVSWDLLARVLAG